MDSLKNKIAIYGNRSQADALSYIPELLQFLKDSGFRVFIQSRFFEYLESHDVNPGEAVPVDHVPAGISLVVSIGGDGTILRATRWIGDKEIPLVGINTGHLGFLTACGIIDACDMIRDVCCGNVAIEKRMLLEVRGEAVPEDMRYALNEIGFMRHSSSSMLSVRASVGESFLADYKGDGLVISTPTGSTAYSLSAGGPIIEPTVECMCLTPLATHTLTLRPFVANADSVIILNPQSRSGKFTLSLDDRSVVIPAEGEYVVRKAPFAVLLVRKKGTGFASVLRDKMLWSLDSSQSEQ